jgi:PncC family amidohydrolase
MDTIINDSAQSVVDTLRKRGQRIAFAESCTGGLAAAAITDIPGSSAVLDMSVVTYADSAKIAYTDVTREVLDAHGAVSSETAKLMAAGIRARAGADIGVGITGIAGPDGGSEAKPVGTVWIAVDYGDVCDTQRFNFAGNRRQIREQTVSRVLAMLR